VGSERRRPERVCRVWVKVERAEGEAKWKVREKS
jgi:hypothetical protein